MSLSNDSRFFKRAFSYSCFLVVLAACGGGGDPAPSASPNAGPNAGPTPAPSPAPAPAPAPVGPTASCADLRAKANIYTPAIGRPQEQQGESGSGDGGGGGGGGGGAEGQGGWGQIFNARVVVKDLSGNVLRDFTSPDGTLGIDLKDCGTEPLEVQFIGQLGAFYYDERLRQNVDFRDSDPPLRVYLSNAQRNFVVSPGTTAAASFADSSVQTASDGNRSRTSKAATKALVDDANERVSRILSDQVPGNLRRNDQGVIGTVPVEGAAVVLNQTTASQAGALPDAMSGRRGAVLAGLVEGAGTFLGQVDRPAVEMTEQLVADLADGKLDLQGANGPVMGPVPAAPAYTYESLWRAKSIGAGQIISGAGDQGLRSVTSNTVITDISASSREIYDIETDTEGRILLGTFSGQTVRLFADGRLTIRRSMSGDFRRGDNGFASSSPAANEQEFVVPGGPFVDAKVGDQGALVALNHVRSRIAVIPRMEPFRSNSFFAGQDAQTVRVAMDNIVRQVASPVIFDIPTRHGANARVVSFVPSPNTGRSFAGTPPDFLYVLNDGSLWAGNSRSAQSSPIPFPAEGLLGVAYDKFVPPASGGWPFQGPRRLFGLTRTGEVRVWLEGQAVGSTRLPIPGKVVLLAAESRTNIYALTSDGDVFWINADQAVSGSGGQLNYLFPLNRVERVPLPAKACWIARSEAVLCDTGRVSRWVETAVRWEERDPSGGLPQRAILPGGLGQVLPPSDWPAVWRMTGAQEAYAIVGGSVSFTQGMNYLMLDERGPRGAVASPGELDGKRNLLEPVCIDGPEDRGGGCRVRVDREVLKNAVQNVFRANGPLSSEALIDSTFASTRESMRIGVQVEPTDSSGGYRMRLRFVEGGRDDRPDIVLQARLNSDGRCVGERAAFKIEEMFSSGDRYESSPLVNDPLCFVRRTAVPSPPPLPGTEDFFTSDATQAAWQATYPRSVDSAEPISIARMRAIPQVNSDGEGIKFCVGFGGQKSATSSKFGGLICTVHDELGNYKGVSATYSTTAFPGGRRGRTDSFDFNQYVPWPTQAGL